MGLGFHSFLTMAQNLNTIAQLQRKIERLEAQLTTSQSEEAKWFAAYRDNLFKKVDCEIRIEQAMHILNGEES